jgi:hypothetical protein
MTKRLSYKRERALFKEERPSDWLSVIRPHNPEAMYDLLRHSNSFWDTSTNCLFRGQGNSDWKLLPSAWREQTLAIYAADRARLAQFFPDLVMKVEGAENLYEKFSPKHISEAKIQLCLEFDIVSEFYQLCDEVGLAVPRREVLISGRPHPIPGIAEILGTWHTSTILQEWIPTEIFALAQHHGVQTRLLDFSYNPKKALLFAIRDILDGGVKSKEFCVWAIAESYMLNLALSHYRPDGLKQIQITQMRFPRHDNVFLRQQDGRFFFLSNADNWKLSKGTYPDLESVLDWYFKTDSPRPARAVPPRSVKFTLGHDGQKEYVTLGSRVYLPLAYKIVAPTEYAAPIYELLMKDFLTEIHLMPTYDNVAKYMQRNRLSTRNPKGS